MTNRQKIHKIIFEADSKSGKIFDVVLLIAILLSVIGVMLESVETIEQEYGKIILSFEWFFTILFTVEYALRIYSIKKPLKYIFSFMGIVDFLAIIPTYLMFLYPPIHFLVDVRVIRIIRVFRIFKLSRYIRGAHIMQIALRSSRPKIIVFLISILLLVIVLGTLMYIVEGLGAGTNGFKNIPDSIYWSIVTLTTVGFGNVFPVTVLGKLISTVIMIMGYAIIAVPTGIVTASLVSKQSQITTKSCIDCSKEGHDQDAKHCKFCGVRLE